MVASVWLPQGTHSRICKKKSLRRQFLLRQRGKLEVRGFGGGAGIWALCCADMVIHWRLDPSFVRIVAVVIVATACEASHHAKLEFLRLLLFTSAWSMHETRHNPKAHSDRMIQMLERGRSTVRMTLLQESTRYRNWIYLIIVREHATHTPATRTMGRPSVTPLTHRNRSLLW